MAIDKLNQHYSMNNPASVYDEEALTALELAARTTAKVNETVDGFNNLKTETETHLDTQDKTITQRLEKQDTAITKMNDVTMPAKVTSEVQRKIDSGEFDRSIDHYAGELEGRLDNLLGQVVEGTTSGDAELIDIRVDTNGTTHENAGASVRSMNAERELEISMLETFKRVNLVRGLCPWYYNGNLEKDTADGGYVCSLPIYLKKGVDVYTKTTKSFYGTNLFFCEVKENGDAVAKHTFAEKLTYEGIEFVRYRIPKNGLYSFNLIDHYLDTRSVFVGYDYKDYTDRIGDIETPEKITEKDDTFERPNLIRKLELGYMAVNGTIADVFEPYYHTEPIHLYYNDVVYVTDCYSEYGGNFACYLIAPDSTIRRFGFEQDGEGRYFLKVPFTGSYVFNTIKTGCVCKNPEDLGKAIGVYAPDDFIADEKSAGFNVNPLYKKSIAFDGDSICHGTSVGEDDPTYGYGWAGRIGVNNEMDWKNYGISGGVITSGMTVGTGVRHSVCDTVNAIYANTPNLDYLIFEGGTNDADIIKNTEKFGSMNLDDYSGDYDETTFCGALDTLFYRAVSLFPNTKIGFIIAQKMGDWSFTAEGNIRRKYFDQVITACKKWGIPFIDLWEGSPLNPKVTQHYNKTLDGAGNIAAGSFYTDGQHLTAKGYDRITPMIEAWIKTL